MNRNALWKKVREELNGLGILAKMPKSFKESLTVDQIISDWNGNIQTEEILVEQIIDQFNKGLHHKEITGPPRKRYGQTPPPEYIPTSQDWDKAQAIQEFVCLQMNSLPYVRQFRSDVERITSRRLLKNLDELWRFITSPLSMLFRADQIADWGISPLVGETTIVSEQLALKPVNVMEHSFVTGERPRVAGRRTYEFVDRDTVFLVVTVRLPDGTQQSIEHKWEERIVLTPGYGDFTNVAGLSDEVQGVSPSVFHSPFSKEEWSHIPRSDDRKVQGFVGTVTGQALSTCQYLCSHYSISYSEAMVFLLLGKMPEPSTISSSVKHFPLIDIKRQENTGAALGTLDSQVPLWLSGEQLRTYFMEMQEWYGVFVRPVPNLPLFRFVNTRYADALDAGMAKPTWNQLFKEWQQSRPAGAASPKSYNNFRNAYMDTFNSLVRVIIDYRKFRKSETEI